MLAGGSGFAAGVADPKSPPVLPGAGVEAPLVEPKVNPPEGGAGAGVLLLPNWNVPVEPLAAFAGAGVAPELKLNVGVAVPPSFLPNWMGLEASFAVNGAGAAPGAVEGALKPKVGAPEGVGPGVGAAAGAAPN